MTVYSVRPSSCSVMTGAYGHGGQSLRSQAGAANFESFGKCHCMHLGHGRLPGTEHMRGEAA
eukprot:364623-Chlamydomonas_euryale.AAC.6